MRYFLKQIKFVKKKDIWACFVFLAALPIAWIYKFKRKHLWLVCERSDEARDNGYWFYKYIKEKHPEIDCVYAIKKTSSDYHKLTKLGGEIIEFGSFKHWVYYLTAELNISSQKEGKPNAAVCHFLEIYGIWKNKRVYLKHGIVCNDLKWHYYDVMKTWLYICSTKKEYDYCKEKFGYSDDGIVLTGLPRYDNLNNDLTDKKVVFIMPTRREWLARPIKDYKIYDNVFDFEDTEYFKSWKDVLEDPKFNRCIEENGLEVVFFLHPGMQKYSQSFERIRTKATIKCNSDVDLQHMLKKAGMLITDYSSICFDFAYMKKPLLYYQFDYDKFRKGQYQEGYFSYKEDGFGRVCVNSADLVDEFCRGVELNMEMQEEYLNRVNGFFKFFDNNNCHRVYCKIIEKLKGKE